jgi:hypothetical protein
VGRKRRMADNPHPPSSFYTHTEEREGFLRLLALSSATVQRPFPLRFT